jgi:hypothetical protein
VNRHAAAHPAVAFGHRFIPLEFWVNGARYSIRVSMLFLAVLALVEPLDNSLVGTLKIVSLISVFIV